MRLIDADALFISKEYCLDEAGFGASYYVVHKSDIDEAPTIEAEPVKHGQWEVFPAGPVAVYGCSLCRTEIPFGKFPDEMRFCPNCGADMRKEKQN